MLDAGAIFDSIRDAARGEGEFVTNSDIPVVNGASMDGAAGLGALLQRRRDEVQLALDRGLTVVVYAAAQSQFAGVAGFTGVDRYFYLPAPEGMSWDASTIVGGEGPQVVVVDQEHPFVPVFESYERETLYRAYFNERAPGFARHAKVFLRSAGGAPVGVEFPVLNGRVIFMPTPRRAGEDWFASNEATAITTAVETLAGRSSGTSPYWTRDFAVPGLEERQDAVERARTAVEQAQSALDAANADLAERTAILDIVWAPGDALLLNATLACAEAIGFERGLTAEGHPVLLDGDTQLHLVVAASPEAVGMAAHYRLRQRLDRVIEQRGIAPRGLIVANGQCDVAPEERQRETEESLRVAAEATRYAVVTARSLFVAAVAALGGSSDETRAAIRQRILSTDGLVSLDDLVPSKTATDA